MVPGVHAVASIRAVVEPVQMRLVAAVSVEVGSAERCGYYGDRLLKQDSPLLDKNKTLHEFKWLRDDVTILH